MSIFLSKKIFIFIAVGIAVLMIVFISFIQTHSVQDTKNPSISPTQVESPVHLTVTPIIPAQGKEYQQSVKDIEKKEATTIQNDTQMGNLLSGLPYQESTFSLKYDFNTNQFIAVVSKDNQSKGLAALDSYINSYGLKRNSIENLVIQYK